MLLPVTATLNTNIQKLYLDFRHHSQAVTDIQYGITGIFVFETSVHS